MFQFVAEGDLRRPGLNVYRLSDPSNAGFSLWSRHGCLLRLRYSKRRRRWSISLGALKAMKG